MSIAGFDPSSCAGITADLKTIAAHGLYGVSCITALTVQTTQGVVRSEPVSPKLVRETLERIVEDTPPSAVKIGMLGTGEVAAEVVRFLRANPLQNLVLDPVFLSSSGAALLDEAGLRIIREELLGMVDIITPNLQETAALTGLSVTDLASIQRACDQLLKAGAKSVVITGGHLDKPVDVLATRVSGEGVTIQFFENEKVETRNTHGTGCAYSTAIACNMALGRPLAGEKGAVLHARDYVAAALREAYDVGKGTGPINHFHSSRFKV